MNMLKSAIEKAGEKSSITVESAHSTVFQPQKLKEVVDIIDLMGNISSRVREDSSGDIGGGGQQGGQGVVTGGIGTSVRDELIKNAPSVPIMKKKLITHLYQEIEHLEKQAKALKSQKQKGSAFLAAELYKKMRRLSSLIADIFEASTEMIKRFYISVFIDRQAITITGGKLTKED